jgi:hypothetical protein
LDGRSNNKNDLTSELKEAGYEDMGSKSRALLREVMKGYIPKEARNSLACLKTVIFSRKILLHGVHLVSSQTLTTPQNTERLPF